MIIDVILFAALAFYGVNQMISNRRIDEIEDKLSNAVDTKVKQAKPETEHEKNIELGKYITDLRDALHHMSYAPKVANYHIELADIPASTFESLTKKHPEAVAFYNISQPYIDKFGRSKILIGDEVYVETKIAGIYAGYYSAYTYSNDIKNKYEGQ